MPNGTSFWNGRAAGRHAAIIALAAILAGVTSLPLTLATTAAAAALAAQQSNVQLLGRRRLAKPRALLMFAVFGSPCEALELIHLVRGA